MNYGSGEASTGLDEEQPDEILVRLVIEGDDRAFRTLMARHYPSVYRLCYYWTGNRDDSEDLCQECFVHLYQVLGQYDPRYRFRVWMYRVCTNRCINWIRANRRARETVPFSHLAGRDVDLADTTPSPHDRVETMEARRILADAVRELPETYRSAILLRYLENLSYKEISVVLGISVKNAEVRVHRAKKLLRERLRVRLGGME